MKKKYAFGLDAVRVLAVVLVSLTHQVVRTGNYNYQPGIVWVFTMLCFYLSHSCVPLFLLLSGYLCGEKRPQKSYFRGIFRVAVPYLLISVLCVLKLWLWCIFRSVTSGTYAGGTTLNTFGCLTTALCAMGLFLLLIRWKQSAFLQRPIREISKVSFELYLCMGIVDPLLYTWIRRSFLEMTLLSLICAWILCKLVRLVSEPMIRWAGRLYDTVIRVS